MNRFVTAYNNVYRSIIGVPKYCSASQMFAYTNVPSCQEVVRKLVHSFIKRLEKSVNLLLVNTLGSEIAFMSLLWKRWLCLLYTQ
jgi:hypothetical protein